MTNKFNKPTYQKPQVRALGSVSAAEGFCFAGGTASLTACSNGVSTFYCSPGGTADDITRPPFCNPTGAVATQCAAGTDAGG